MSQQSALEEQKDDQRSYVLKGAALLDKKKPGWANLIKLKGGELPYAFGFDVLGSIFNSKAEGVRILGIDCNYSTLMNKGLAVLDWGRVFFQCKEGSNVHPIDREAFEQLWKEQILMRRTQTKGD